MFVSLQKRGIVKIDKYYNRGKYTPTVKEAGQKQSFFEDFDEFLKIKKNSERRKQAYMVVIRALKRFELYIRIKNDKSFSLALDNVTSKILSDFDKFLRNEHIFPE
jgi:hypothetical protein